MSDGAIALNTGTANADYFPEWAHTVALGGNGRPERRAQRVGCLCRSPEWSQMVCSSYIVEMKTRPAVVAAGRVDGQGMLAPCLGDRPRPHRAVTSGRSAYGATGTPSTAIRRAASQKLFSAATSSETPSWN